jgi:hypothetical protein
MCRTQVRADPLVFSFESYGGQQKIIFEPQQRAAMSPPWLPIPTRQAAVRRGPPTCLRLVDDKTSVETH